MHFLCQVKNDDVASYPSNIGNLLLSISVQALVKNSSKGMSSCLRHLSWYVVSICLLCGFVFASNVSNIGLSLNWSA